MRIPNDGAALTVLLVTAFLLCCAAARPNASGDRIRVVSNEADRRVDIIIDGQPFTSYIWPTTLKKPVLYPLRTATGIIVTRGYPLEPRAGERSDHPHHAGLWFNYGSVNGIDFWNNSDAIKPEDRHKMGNVVQRKIVAAKSGSEQGELEVETDWVNCRAENPAQRTHPLGLSRRAAISQHRSHHHVASARGKSCLRRRQRRAVRHACRALAGNAFRQARNFPRRQRASHAGRENGQHRSEWCLSDQRRQNR